MILEGEFKFKNTSEKGKEDLPLKSLDLHSKIKRSKCGREMIQVGIKDKIVEGEVC